MHMIHNRPMETKVVGLVKTADEDSYIYGENKHYIIPEYQREYSWEDSQIESFIESIKRAAKGESVFMGTVQFNCEGTDEDTDTLNLHIIDGQQRMTTFLLLCSILEKLSGKDILQKHHMGLKIKNFTSNNDKLKEALAVKYEDIDHVLNENNRYMKNMKLLKEFVDELASNGQIDEIVTTIFSNIYFVELVTKGIPLPQVVDIFNTINTTGLDLNSADLFKLQFYEYLNKKYPNENWMQQICDLYEKVNEYEYKMQDILDIYKHCIGAKHELSWEKLSNSNEKFFEEILSEEGSKGKEDILKFEKFEKIVKIYIDFKKTPYVTKTIDAFAENVIQETRYGRYRTLPYVAAYFNNQNYALALKSAMTAAKYLIVCSVNFDKAINPVQTFMCKTILPALSRNEDIEDVIQKKIRKSPYCRENAVDNWNKEEFKRRIEKGLFYNGKRAYIICMLSALLEEISAKTKFQDIEAKLFAWKVFKYDMEHICAREIFERTDPDNIPAYNGIGNLVVLNRSINRGIGNSAVKEKVAKYENSNSYETEPKFVSVMRVAEQIKAANNIWGIDQVEKRCQEQEKLLCEFLGLD